MRCLFHICLAFDCTFPSQAEAKVITLHIYELIFSYKIRARLHFYITGRGKSDDAKYIRGAMLAYIFSVDCTFPSQAEGKVTSGTKSCAFCVYSYCFALTAEGKVMTLNIYVIYVHIYLVFFLDRHVEK